MTKNIHEKKMRNHQALNATVVTKGKENSEMYVVTLILKF